MLWSECDIDRVLVDGLSNSNDALVCCNQAFRSCILQTLQTLQTFSLYSLGPGQLWPVFEAHRGGTSWARAATWTYPCLFGTFRSHFEASLVTVSVNAMAAKLWAALDRRSVWFTDYIQHTHSICPRFALNELSSSWGWLILEYRTQTLEFMQLEHISRACTR